MSEDEIDDWKAVKESLINHGIPERRAEVAARVDAGQTYREIAEKMDVDSHGSIGNQVDEYRQDIDNVYWLHQNAPEI